MAAERALARSFHENPERAITKRGPFSLRRDLCVFIIFISPLTNTELELEIGLPLLTLLRPRSDCYFLKQEGVFFLSCRNGRLRVEDEAVVRVRWAGMLSILEQGGPCHTGSFPICWLTGNGPRKGRGWPCLPPLVVCWQGCRSTSTA